MESTGANANVGETGSSAVNGQAAMESCANTLLAPHVDERCLVSQALRRGLLNAYVNACCTLWTRVQVIGSGFAPAVRGRPRRLDQRVELRVYGNGGGIFSAAVGNPVASFFTIVPLSESTGSGLLLSPGIGHGGSLAVHANEGAFTVFTTGCSVKSPPPPVGPRA